MTKSATASRRISDRTLRNTTAQFQTELGIALPFDYLVMVGRRL
jgi:hypothetical protein